MKRKAPRITAFLGKDTAFEGTLTFTGGLRIDGRFQGEISTEGTLIIGETAVIRGNIRASCVLVSGEIHGNTVAEQRIEILTPARIFGDIRSPEIIMGAGAVFEGKCQTEIG
ncbi:MAG: polymer-forming cytoskeletal protein [Deltaproteobacteria bacterium]|jgi:cytoskeletal protein CcmA (bactofilin family)|nr:polymer-forming cytoskeletal protein [Deltaproteobacteria bacterium]MBT7716477.1 polymer-forming cytoskeletal protein [Deltaproteobacteria bacterium]